MKRFLYTFLFTLIIVLFATESRAQEYVPFPLSNAIWSEVFTSKQPDEVETYQFGIEGDTVYNNIQYSKLYLLNDTVYPLSVGRYCGGIQEDDMKRIYIIDCDCVMFPTIPIIDEVVLYDFSKSIGDTLFVGMYSFYPFSYLIIHEIDSVLIDGNYRKRFDFGLEEWIEGIGSTRGLLSPIQEQPLGFQNHTEPAYENRYIEYLPDIILGWYYYDTKEYTVSNRKCWIDTLLHHKQIREDGFVIITEFTYHFYEDKMRLEYIDLLAIYDVFIYQQKK